MSNTQQEYIFQCEQLWVTVSLLQFPARNHFSLGPVSYLSCLLPISRTTFFSLQDWSHWQSPSLGAMGLAFAIAIATLCYSPQPRTWPPEGYPPESAGKGKSMMGRWKITSILVCCPHHKQMSSSTGNPEMLLGHRMNSMDAQKPSSLDSGFDTSERGYCLVNTVWHGECFHWGLPWAHVLLLTTPENAVYSKATHWSLRHDRTPLVSFKEEGQLQGLMVLCWYHTRSCLASLTKPRSSRA